MNTPFSSQIPFPDLPEGTVTFLFTGEEESFNLGTSHPGLSGRFGSEFD